MSKKIKLILSGLVLGFAAVATPFLQPLWAQSNACSEIPKVTMRERVQVSGNYRVWVLAKKDTDNAKPYLQIGNGECRELGVPQGNGWEWVSGPNNGSLRQQLSAGEHNFRLGVDNGAIFMDKILVTNDVNCRPTDSGEGCLERPLDFAVAGLADGETIAGSRTISASLVNNVENVTVEFAFNGGPVVSSPSRAPYCLVAGNNNRCGSYDLSRLGAGNHTLRVTARSAAGQTITKVTPFVVAEQNIPVPDPEPAPPAPTPTPDPTPDPTPPAPGPRKGIKVEVSGVKDKDTIKGSPVISAKVSGANKPISVTYKLDSHKLSHRSVAPHCLVVKDNKCAGWDSATFPNGDYRMYVVAEAEGYESVWTTMSVKIDNAPAVPTPAPETPKETAQPTEPVREDSATPPAEPKPEPKPSQPKQNVVVGKSKQQISGWIKLFIPEKYIKPGSTVTFRSGDRVILTVPAIRLATADFDTTQLPNGTQFLSATVATTSGAEEVLSSEVEVKNNPFVSFSRWVDNNRTAAIVGTIVTILAVFGATFFIVRKLYSRQFAKKKPANIEGAVVGASAMSKSQASRQALFGVAAAVLVAVGAFSFVRLGSTALAAGLGFIAEVEDGTFSSDQFTQDMDHAENRTFIRLFHGGGTEPELPDHGHDDEDHDHGDDSNGQPALNCNLPGGRGRGVQMGSNAPCIDVSAIPAPGQSFSTSSLTSTSYSPMPAGQGEAGAFRQRCDYSHMNFDDSVLYPNQPGIAHLHTYFGNADAKAASTSSSLKATGNSTCNGGIFNRSAYWVPSMIDTSTGRAIRPNDPRGAGNSDLEIYYKLGYQGVGYTDIEGFPNGLQLIAGNPATATSAPRDPIHTWYWCEDGANHADRAHRLRGASIPNCGPNQILVMEVQFPQCWDGRNLTSPSGRSHMAYGTWQPGENRETRGCPSTHPVGLPFIQMFVRYHTGAGGNASWRLSSDNYSGPAGYSGHADYIFAWDDTAFPLVIQNCYRARRDCQYGIGNQREPEHIRSMKWAPRPANRIWADWRPEYYN